MRNALQGTATAILLAVALLADGLMGTLGPLDFLLIAGMAVAVAGVLVWLSNRHRKKKAAPVLLTPKRPRWIRRTPYPPPILTE